MKESPIILNRLKKNLKSRKSLIKQENLTAFRLYEKDIPEYPYIIDVYGDNAVIYEKGKRIDQQSNSEINLQQKHQTEIVDAIKETLGFTDRNIIFKKREVKKGKDQYKKLGRSKNYKEISEGKCKFLVNLYDYLDTGLFLDHRPLRKMIYENSKNKKVLNLFSYTGSISVAAALGGALTTTMDMSATYLEWAKDNFELNKIPLEKHKFFQRDLTSTLKKPLKDKFDIIILDPPSFSNSKRMEDSFNVQDDHEWMIISLMQSLNPKGVLYFSNNFRKFKLSEKISNNYQVKDISFKTIPKDFRDQKIHQCYEIQNFV